MESTSFCVGNSNSSLGNSLGHLDFLKKENNIYRVITNVMALSFTVLSLKHAPKFFCTSFIAGFIIHTLSPTSATYASTRCKQPCMEVGKDCAGTFAESLGIKPHKNVQLVVSGLFLAAHFPHSPQIYSSVFGALLGTRVSLYCQKAD